MRNLYLAVFVVFFSLISRAQPYGNEWINYSQQYYKIKINKNGIYRIDSTALSNAGIPVNTINPQNFQLFARGEEQAIYINGENDGVFNGADYIEFYGLKNDGSLDSLVFIKKSKGHPNPYLSLFNDTIQYFLTWNSSLNNKRLTIESDTSFLSYTPSDYFLKEQLINITSNYWSGETYSGTNVTDPEYTECEGFFHSQIGRGSSKTYPFNTTSAYLSGPPATLNVRIAGESNYAGLSPDHHLRISFGSIIKDSIYEGYKLNHFSFQVPVTDLNNSSTNLIVQAVDDLGNTNNPDYNSLVYTTLKFPHSLSMEGASEFDFYLPDDGSQSKSFLQMSNFNNGGSGVRLYDLTNRKIIPVINSSSIFKALVPNAGGEKKCYITSENNIKKIITLSPAGTNGFFTDFSLNPPDSAYIIVTNKVLMAEAMNYKTYRSLDPNGGQFDAIIVDVDDLYDQFALGIPKHPIAIRRFADFALDTWPSDPQYLFLLGKAVHARHYRFEFTSYKNCLVPSIGNQSSDNLFTSGLNGAGLEPAIPTGRLAAKTPAEVALYLDKVKEYEANGAEEWMKNIMHFGGGNKINDQKNFANYLKKYEDIIEDTLFGGNVHTFLKTTSAPIQINTSDSVRDLIEGGVSLMTFYGHASGTGFDQSIDDPQNYNNKGKYPMLLANSCFAGDLHGQTPTSSSETFVLIKDKGVIAYIGSVSLGIANALDKYSSAFYKNFGSKNYGKSIGKNIQQAIIDAQVNPYGLIEKSVFLEMTLHGDPAIVLNSHKYPDYSINNSNVFFDTKTEVDSFTLLAGITNIGKAINDSFTVEVLRRFPNGETMSYYKFFKAPLFKDTVAIKMPVDFVKGIGLNQFKVTLDLYGEIIELSENNNTTNPDVELLLAGGDIAPVFPYKYAVVSTNTVTLKASTANLFAPVRNYIMELDTTDEFNSPFKSSTTINSSGGLIEWKPILLPYDSIVYFWRVSTDSIDTTGFQWRESSFQYIQGKTGWGQAHFFQFKNNQYQFVKHSRPTRDFMFFNDVTTIHCNSGYYSKYLDYYAIKAGINLGFFSPWTCACGTGAMNIVIIDPISGKFVPSVNQGGGLGQYGNHHCVNNNLEWFAYTTNPSCDATARQRMRNFIDTVPDGYHVLAYSINNPRIHEDTLLYQAFESIGSSQIRTIPSDRPYLIWGRKGEPIGSATELIGDSTFDVLQFQDTFTTNWTEGQIMSEMIGPAKTWGSLHWRHHALEDPALDNVVLKIIGITTVGEDSVLATFPMDSLDVMNLPSYIDALVYPYMKLQAVMSDDSLHTPLQIDSWHVLYTPVPEAALNPLAAFSLYDKILQEGDQLKLALAIQNISEQDFTDSLLMTYWVEDKDRIKHNLPSKLKAAPFKAGTTIIDTVEFSTAGYPGSNVIWVEANPIGFPKSQLEQFHFNNIARVEFTVETDNVNPLLDVTFDGLHILNGDIVSTKPNILIQLKDENKYLALNDTSDFSLFLKRPGTQIEELLHFGPELSFTPAVLPKNSCKINYTPSFTEDGTYQLIVQAKDRTNNLSGQYDYKIDFEVITKSTITEVLNYPNPFSTSTRFVFTLTGGEVPSIFKIQVLTITGKVVREITKDELGSIHIGRNITEYSWDGKDEFGDQLANGIYLYRVVTQINGQSIEKRESGADQFISKGFGKMYLMR